MRTDKNHVFCCHCVHTARICIAPPSCMHTFCGKLSDWHLDPISGHRRWPTDKQVECRDANKHLDCEHFKKRPWWKVWCLL